MRDRAGGGERDGAAFSAWSLMMIWREWIEVIVKMMMDFAEGERDNGVCDLEGENGG